ncbi:MAG: phosphoglucosamine mutase [Pseudomonadota bacterium]
MGKYFGTDGIRGPVGTPPMAPGGMVKFASAVAAWLNESAAQNGRHLVLVGGDTRNSTPWIMDVLCGTLAGQGIDVCPMGVVSTPQLAFETAQSPASAGVMVTASHNPALDNGVKLFGRDGFKLSDDAEAAIEALMDTETGTSAPALGLGLKDHHPFEPSYLEHLSELDGIDIKGLKIVIDAANGAAFRSVETLFGKMGADAVYIGVEPNGLNINDGVGATHTSALSRRVIDEGAFAGVALDGDGDRLIMVDEAGNVVDGDQLLALLAQSMQEAGKLSKNAVAATVMSNLGLERFLVELGVALERTPVGDRHVVSAMRANGMNLGGEQSGHIVIMDSATTGDGLLAALHVLNIAAQQNRPFSEIARVFDPVPQKLVNLRFGGANPLEDQTVIAKIEDEKIRLGAQGRVLVRKSGTEPLIRIMVEAVDPSLLDQTIGRLTETIEAAV